MASNKTKILRETKDELEIRGYPDVSLRLIGSALADFNKTTQGADLRYYEVVQILADLTVPKLKGRKGISWGSFGVDDE